MARTAAADRLTEQHRAQQLAVRAGSLRDLVQLWQAVDPADLAGTIGTFAHAAGLLAGQGFDQSGAVAARYYRLFRFAEGVPGVPPAGGRIVKPTTEQLAGQLRGAALSGIINARRAGMSLEGASRNGFVKAAGMLAKLVLTGGRMRLMQNVQDDKQALGWGRVTTGNACAFCRMVASRGPVYKTERSADFESHDGCGCTAEPIYRGDSIDDIKQAVDLRSEYDAAQAWARETGNMPSKTSNNSLNAYRRYLSAGKPTPGEGGKSTEGSGENG
jgi:hypothetical protein